MASKESAEHVFGSCGGSQKQQLGGAWSTSGIGGAVTG